MSTPEAGWVWLRGSETSWRVGSVHQKRADLTVLSDDEVRSTVIDFITRLKRGAAEELETDISRYVESQAT